MWFKYGLKAQKLLAQGSALGIMDANLSPCKGKSFVYQPGILKLLPLQGALLIASIPRALPWARSFCPFRACCFRSLWTFSPLLERA